MRGLGVEPTPTIAEALYVGLVTDTGRFMYENTGTRAHVMAAELIEAGVDVHEVYRRLYEGIPYGKLALLARALANVERYDDGALTLTRLSAAGLRARPAPRRTTPRASSTTCARSRARRSPRSCATGSGAGQEGSARSRCAPPTTRRRLGDRPRPGRRRPPPGGRLLHRAGVAELVAFLRGEVAAQLPRRRLARRGRSSSVDKPAGHDLARRRRAGAPRAPGSAVGHAGTLDPFATGLLLVLVGRATRAQRFLMALPKTYVAVARLGAMSSTGDPEGEITETGRRPASRWSCRRARSASARRRTRRVKVDGERAYRRARRGEEVELPERKVTVHRFEESRREGDRASFEIECSSGTYVRSLIADLGDAYCRSCAARRSARSRRGRRPEQDRSAGRRARASCPSAAGGRGGPPRLARGRRPGRGRAGRRRLLDERGLIALAEPREAGMLKPVVGFRRREHHHAARRRAATAPRRGRRVRRRPPRPPRGDRGQRHGADVRAAPAVGRRARATPKLLTTLSARPS